MAQRRMFAKTVIDSDAFLDMPATAQLLYFHLAMRADDDGFINKPKTIMRMTGCKDDDINLLIAKKFIIPFETGVVVIKHWKIHNYIAKDRYSETKYVDEKSLLTLDKNNAYTLCDTPVYGMETTCAQPVYGMETQVRLGKDSLVQDSMYTKNTPQKYGTHQNVTLSTEELEKLKTQFPNDYQERIDRFSSGLATYGYKYKSHYLAILQWAENDRKEAQPKYHASTQVTEEVNWDVVNAQIPASGQ